MTFNDLNDLFKFEDYTVLTNPNYPNVSYKDALLIAFHHSGDSGYINEKLHQNQDLTDLESFYVASFLKVIQKLPRTSRSVVFRNEINDDSIMHNYRTVVKNCLKENTPLKIKSFWNFTENEDWQIENGLIWKVSLLENTNASVAHYFYPPIEKLPTDELEVIFPPNSKFEVKEFTEHLIHLQELE